MQPCRVWFSVLTGCRGPIGLGAGVLRRLEVYRAHNISEFELEVCGYEPSVHWKTTDQVVLEVAPPSVLREAVWGS